MTTPLIAEVREALAREWSCRDPLCPVCAANAALLDRLDGMAIVPAGELERLEGLVMVYRPVYEAMVKAGMDFPDLVAPFRAALDAPKDPGASS